MWLLNDHSLYAEGLEKMSLLHSSHYFYTVKASISYVYWKIDIFHNIFQNDVFQEV